MRRVAESGGLTALHYAARRGDMEIVELLLEHGAKPSIKNDMGRDVLS
jgi:palmitoyltransferase